MNTLFDILKEVRPKRALFTSYTYSSIWFEAGPYPLLRKNDCEQITVMLDAREARHSVDNSSSRFGGSRYRVISTLPTGAGAGIFHPKIAYLESDNGDVFVVGSGNLTVRGQGRSLEVLDVVSATTDPHVFGQIADFFEQLPDRLAMLQESDRDVLLYFAKRARTQMALNVENTDDPQSVWLVTTLKESAASQFIQLARDVLSPPNKLTVLSPFFDRDVSAVTRLRDAIRVKTVQYGLARNRDGLIAPFLDDIKKGDKPTLFIEPPGNDRPLHAKWFDLTGDNGDALVMTGSVNATQQSLWNINNIEVSLVRHVPHSSVKSWRKTKTPPYYLPCEYPAPLSEPHEMALAAQITRQNVLEVQFSQTPSNQRVQLKLHHANRRFQPIQATIDDKNIAKASLGEKFINELSDAALWLTASGNGFEVTTWVNIEPQLRVKPAQVDLFKALGRVEENTGDDEDVFLLFNAGHLLLTRRNLRSQGKPGRKVLVAKDGEEGDPLVSEAEWLAGQGNGIHQRGFPNSETIRIFKAIGKLLEMSNTDIEKALAPIAVSESSDDLNINEDEPDDEEDDDLDESTEGGGAISRDDRKSERKRRLRRESLVQARQTLQLAIDNRLAQPMPDALAMLIVPQKIRNNLREGMPSAMRFVDLGQAKLVDPVSLRHTSYLTGLLPTLMAMKLGPTAIHNLLPMIASATALIALCLTRRSQSVSYDQLRASLESLAGLPLAERDYQSFLESEWREGRMPRMLQFEMRDLLVQMRQIARAPRVEDRIDEVIKLAIERKDAVPDDMKDFEYVVKALRYPTGTKWKLYSVVVIDDFPSRWSCPQCYGPLNPDEYHKLKSVRMAVCSERCHRPIFLKMGNAATHKFPRENEACVRDHRAKSDRDGGRL